MIERFWAKVARGDAEQCWEWSAARMLKGYGVFKLKNPRRNDLAHRLAWMLTHGPIPEGMQVCHRCDNPPCCNPAHLFVGTHAENMADKLAKDRHPRGERSPRAKLTEGEVSVIRAARAAGLARQRELAAFFSISEAQVSRIVHRERWARS